MGIYLDNAATTKIAPEVLDAMMPYLTEQYGNAGSKYKLGRTAADAIAKARCQVAEVFRCEPEHIIFTSGASESNSMTFKGIAPYLKLIGKTHLIVSEIEHDSVLHAAQSLVQDGFTISYVQPDNSGRILVEAVESLLSPNTGLVSVMAINNELGTMNDALGIGKLCKDRDILFHCDCTQAYCVCPIYAEDYNFDFASVSAHKVHGPKGVGALYIKNKNLIPLINGGAAQEYGLRGGTENTAGIVGFGCASEIEHAYDLNAGLRGHYLLLKGQLYGSLTDHFPKGAVVSNGCSAFDYSKILSLRFPGVDSETLILALDANDIQVSSGSACHGRAVVSSRVLKAIGLTEEENRSTIRISVSRYTTEEELDAFAIKLIELVEMLRTCK